MLMHVTLIVPAPFTTVSGGYLYDRRIVDGLRALGHVVDILELDGSHPVTDETGRDAACDALDRLRPGTKPVIDGLALPAFAGLDDALAAVGAVGLIHHPVSLETGMDGVTQAALRAIEQRMLPRLARLVVTSEYSAETLTKEFGVDRGRVGIVIPGTEDAPRSPGSKGPSCEILSIGALIPRKGHDLLIRALARLFDLDWHLSIVGSAKHDPVHASSLSALTEEVGVRQRVSFIGEVTGEALDALWRDADLFALATHFEGYGMAIAEALKHGVPVVVTAGGAAGSQVPRDAGLVCPVGDRDQLSKSLRRLIFGNALRLEMAEGAWQAGRALPSWANQAALFAQAIGEPAT